MNYLQYYINNTPEILAFHREVINDPVKDKFSNDVWIWLNNLSTGRVIDLEKTPPANPELFIKCICLYRYYINNIQFLSDTKIIKL